MGSLEGDGRNITCSFVSDRQKSSKLTLVLHEVLKTRTNWLYDCNDGIASV
jgi:hypothetical protein